jgi:hypothetical protein
LDHIVETKTLDHSVAAVTLDTIVAFDAIVSFVIPLVALLTSSPVMLGKDHLSNFNVFQRVRFSNLV